MIDNKTVSTLIPFSIHDGIVNYVNWDNNKLQINLVLCKNSHEKRSSITLCFYGVHWIRSVCDENHDGYIKGTPYENYPLIEKDDLNSNYEEYVSYGLLDDILVLETGVLCINDIFFFDCSSVEILNSD